MTVPQILAELKPVKPISRVRLYFYFNKFNIKPLGERQVPQQYPADTPHRILLKFGLAPQAKVAIAKEKRFGTATIRIRKPVKLNKQSRH